MRYSDCQLSLPNIQQAHRSHHLRGNSEQLRSRVLIHWVIMEQGPGVGRRLFLQHATQYKNHRTCNKQTRDLGFPVPNILPVSSFGIRHREVLQTAGSVLMEHAASTLEAVHYLNYTSQDVQITYFKNCWFFCSDSVRSSTNGYQHLLVDPSKKQTNFPKYVIFGITDGGQVHKARVLTEP